MRRRSARAADGSSGASSSKACCSVCSEARSARPRLRRRARAAGDRAAESAAPQRNRGRCANVGVRGQLSLLSSVLFGLIGGEIHGAADRRRAGKPGPHDEREPRAAPVRSAMVVVQVAIALVLLVSAGLMIRTFQSIRTVDPGFTQPDNLQILRIFVSVAPTAEQTTRIENAIQDKLASIPGVTSAAFGSAMPMEGFGPNLGVVNFGGIRAQDQTTPPSDSPPVRLFKCASPGFFAPPAPG